MSARADGAPLWAIRPIVEGLIREDRSEFFVGTFEAAMKYATQLHESTGLQHAVAAVS